jgi:glycosyltransferase involved in cell wall biosynthesis
MHDDTAVLERPDLTMRGATVRDTSMEERADESRMPLGVRDARLDALYLVNGLGIGGSERKIVRLVNRLRHRGVHTGIAYLNGPETLVPMLHPEVPRWHLERKGKFSLSAARRLAQILEATHCRTLFTVNMYPTLYAAAARTLLGKRAPRLIGLVNTTDFGAGQRWRQALYKRVLDRFDRIVYGCETQRAAWEADQAGAGPPAMVVYNGVDLQEFSGSVPSESVQALRAKLGLSPQSFVVGSVGRLVAAKNHRVLIDALAAVRRRGVDARLVIVGEGELRQELERHASIAGVADAVVLTGALTDLRPALALMDVFVLPSLYVETFSNAALEAMAMGKAVVLSNVGGAAEMVRDGIDGRVLAPAALDTELPGLIATLASERQTVLRLGCAARKRVEEKFSFDDMVAQYEALIGRAPNDARCA